MCSTHVKPRFAVATNVDVFAVQHNNLFACLRLGLRLMRTRWPKSQIAPTISILCFWLFIGHSLSMATQTMLIISNQQVIIAADSLFTGKASPRKGCKIRQSGRFFWTAEGVNNSADRRFDIDKLIYASARSQFSLPEMLDRAGLQIVPALQREIPRLKRQEPSFYSRAKESGVILKLLAARETGVGVGGYIKEFHISDDDKVSATPAHTCSKPGECRFYSSTVIRQYVNTHPEIWSGDVVSTVNLLLGLAIDADSAYSARPISILQLAPNNTRWLQQNDCSDIRRDGSKKQAQQQNK
jgi:hypothetical protein